MRKLLCEEHDAVAGGISLGGGFGYGPVPGFGSDDVPNGLTYGKSFDSGWSLGAGFAKDGTRGIEIRYDWK
jgi:hypothetical protein